LILRIPILDRHVLPRHSRLPSGPGETER
jgi:hypothetical protein